MGKPKTYKSDESLAQACARSDQRAQRALYDRYVNVMYNTAYRYCFNKEVAEDILQITFTKVFHSLKKYNPQKGTLKAWIRRICINTAIDVQKKESKWEPSWDNEWEVKDEQLFLDKLDAEHLLLLISRLPDDLRTIFNLHEIEGYSHEEIAEMTGINVNSCRVYLSRAKKQLRKAIELFEAA